MHKFLCFLVVLIGFSFSWAGVLPKEREQRIMQAVPTADVDKNGELSIEELEKAIPSLPERYHGPLNKFVNAYNAKNSGSSSSSPSKSTKNTSSSKSVENFKYGEHERQAFDLYLAESETPTPLLLFIHGGGFKKGDKASFGKNPVLKSLLEKGISCASTNYRFSNQNEAGLLGCMMDSKLALQTIRYHAEKWNIDKDRIMLMGGSAGAGTSMWIGFRDEMANPNSENPIERESTRVKGVIATAIQATYHFERWPDILNSEKQSQSTEKNEMYANTTDALSKLGVSHNIQRELDMLEWLSSDDPPLYVFNRQKDSQLDLSNPKHRGPSLHHPLHVKAVAERAEQVSLQHHYLFAPGIDLKSNTDIEIVDFVLKFI